MLSVIIPAYNEEPMIKKTVVTISSLLQKEKIPYELLFVDDGSTDKTWDIISSISANDSNVKGVSFSRNFGKESAIFAGLSSGAGDCFVVIDCDLQHPPHKIVEMYRLWEQGYEVIEGIKTNRGKESAAHSFAAKSFYKIISSATGINMENASDFKLLDRKAVTVLLNMKEKRAFFRALSSWIGFKTTSVEFEVQSREIGETKWSTKSLIKYAISNITSFTTAPIQIVSIFGFITFFVGLVFSIITIIQKIRGTALGGFSTLIILNFFTSSIVMISLGIIGYYISRIYEEVKGRPRYIIGQTANLNDQVNLNDK